MLNQTCPENKENTTSKIRSATRMLITATLAFGALALSSLTGASITCAEAQTVAPATRQSGAQKVAPATTQSGAQTVAAATTQSGAQTVAPVTTRSGSQSELGVGYRVPYTSYDWNLLSPTSPMPSSQYQSTGSLSDPATDAITARLAQDVATRFADVLEQPGLDALSRLNAFFARVRQIEIENAPKLRASLIVPVPPPNLLNQQLNAAVIKAMTPVMARIIAQGKMEGMFNVTNPEAAAEAVLQISIGGRDAITYAIAASGTPNAAAASETLENRLRFQETAIARVLGLPDETIILADPNFTQAIMAVR